MNGVAASTVLAGVLEPSAWGGCPAHWDEALAAMPEGGLPFLDPGSIPGRRQAAGLTEDHDAALLAIAATIAGDPWLRALAWYLYWRVFVSPECGIAWGVPSLKARLDREAGAFFLLLALELAPRMRAWHRRFGYPPGITTQTLRQIQDFEINYQRGAGGQGIYGHQFVWMSCYLTQPYVRLGRFEYEMHPFSGTIAVWKRGCDGVVLALAGEGTRVASDGLGLPATAPCTEGWIARYTEGPDRVTGYPIDPRGRILERTLTLDRSQWTCCFKPGDWVVDLHIPAGGAMTPEAMADSLRQVMEFFPVHHPDRPVRAIVLTTWFMDPRLADLLPSEANPLVLQRAGYLYPVPAWQGGLWFVFLQDTFNPATLPRTTSLQRAIAGFLERGGTWNGGGWFLLPEDASSLVDGRYRDRVLPLLASLDAARME